MRVFLGLISSTRGMRNQSTKAEDEPRNIPDTCQEQNEIDPGANGKSKSPGTWEKDDSDVTIVLMSKYGNEERTETSTSAVLETFPEIVDLDSWLTTVPPNHPSGLSETLLIVGEDDEVVEGSYGITPWRGLRVGKAWRQFCLPTRIGRWRWNWGGHGQVTMGQPRNPLVPEITLTDANNVGAAVVLMKRIQRHDVYTWLCKKRSYLALV
jgi:hypothetical protein